MRLAAELRERLRAFLFGTREDRELDDELAFHLGMAVEENLRRGMDPAEAQRQAHLRLGGLAQTREATRNARGLRWLDDLLRDVRFAVRRLVREPGYSVPTIATIALGIGVTAAVYALVNAILLRPLPYPDAERLVEIRHTTSGAALSMTGLSTGTFLHYREGNRVFEELGVYTERMYTVTDPGAPEQLRIAPVSPSLLPVLQATPRVGRLPIAADFEFGVRTGVFISHDLWVRRYGSDPDIVGRAIEIERRRETVVGVAQPGFHFPNPETHVWTVRPEEEMQSRFGPRAGIRGLYLTGIGRLRPDVTPEEAERDLDRLVRTLPDAYPDITTEQIDEVGLRAVVVPLKDALVEDVRTALLLLLTTAGFLLLITWANTTDLTLARTERLRTEIALERALGAREARIARRFVVESVLIATLGGVLGLALAYAPVELRFGFDIQQIPRLGEVAVDRAVVGLVMTLSILTAAHLTMVALWSAGRPQRAGVLTAGLGRMTASRTEQTGRRLLVSAQVGLGLMLLIGSALMVQSFWRLKQIDLGFESGGTLTFFMPIPPNVYGNYHRSVRVHDEVLGRIRALPGVEAVEAANIAAFPLTPVPAYYNARVEAAGRPVTDSADAPSALFAFATPGYFRVMGIPLLRGRTFQRIDTSREAPGVVLSAALARDLFGRDDPIGGQVRWANSSEFPPYTVVGVVGDVPSEAVHEGPSRVLYFPNLHPPQADTITGVVHIYIPSDEMYVVRTSLPPTSLVPAIRRSIDAVDPKLVMTRIGTLDELVARSMARARVTMILLVVGAGTALVLGLLGIYGVLAYTVRQRTPELGIRIALGASPAGVVRMVVRQGAALALAGIAAGLVAASALTRFVRSLLYEVSPGDPLAFVGMAILIFAVALAASYVPARRAGRIDPARVLKAE